MDVLVKITDILLGLFALFIVFPFVPIVLMLYVYHEARKKSVISLAIFIIISLFLWYCYYLIVLHF